MSEGCDKGPIPRSTDAILRLYYQLLSVTPFARGNMSVYSNQEEHHPFYEEIIYRSQQHPPIPNRGGCEGRGIQTHSPGINYAYRRITRKRRPNKIRCRRIIIPNRGRGDGNNDTHEKDEKGAYEGVAGIAEEGRNGEREGYGGVDPDYEEKDYGARIYGNDFEMEGCGDEEEDGHRD